MKTAANARLVPVPDDMSRPYWEACARHVLTLARCSACGEFCLPPDITCPNCHSIEPAFRFEPVTPRGTIRTWTVIRQSFLSGFEVPFVLLDVQLAEQPHVRLVGRLLGDAERTPAIGDAVKVVFEDLAPGIAVPAFSRDLQA